MASQMGVPGYPPTRAPRISIVDRFRGVFFGFRGFFSVSEGFFRFRGAKVAILTGLTQIGEVSLDIYRFWASWVRGTPNGVSRVRVGHSFGRSVDAKSTNPNNE